MGTSASAQKSCIGVLAALAFWSGCGTAQDTRAANDSAWVIPANDAIRQLLAERMARNGVGIVVGIIEPAGQRVVAHGRSGAPDGRPLDGDTVFQIGSVTKVFTALLLADMVQRGEVKLDDPAAKYLPPGVRMPERGRPITLLDLSKHTSALPSMPTNFSLFARPDPYAAYTEEQLYRFLSTHRLSREPGKQEYSNVGVALLGRLLARHAGMEYEPFLRERVLDPLGLASTSITPTEDQRRRLAPGHDRFLQPIETWEMRAMPASGSLRSTANDLLKFLAFNLGQRETPLYPAMTAQRTPMRALGWGRTKLGGDDVYGHDGGKAGYRSAAIFNPRTRTGVVVLTNARTDDRPMSLAAHLLFNGARLPPAPEAPKRPTMAALKPAQLERLSGRYRLEAGGMLAIARRDDHLLVDSLGDGVASFLPASPQDFFSNTEDEQISFEVEGEHAIGLVLTAAGKASKAARVGDL